MRWVLVLGIVFLIGCSAEAGRYDDFAQCITDSGAVVFSGRCPELDAQKKILGTSFQYINYISCEEQPDICIEQGIDAYPLWLIEGEEFTGAQSIHQLEKLTRCRVLD